MTPNNICNMAAIKGLNLIAVTDHNAVANGIAAMEAAKKNGLDLLVIPGMEAESSEEIHVVCLFPTVEAALEFQGYIWETLPPVKNRTDIFGEQLLMDEEDKVIGMVENLLSTASGVDFAAMVRKAAQLGGIAYPAHVDRPSYSVISNLGFLPPDLGVGLVEISKNVPPQEYMDKNVRLLGGVRSYMQSSDAHYLEDINEAVNFLDVEEATGEGVIRALRKLAGL